jgi:hypothetical protein
MSRYSEPHDGLRSDNKQFPTVGEQMEYQRELLRHIGRSPLQEGRRSLPEGLLAGYTSLAARSFEREVRDSSVKDEVQPLVVFAPTLLRGFFPTWFFTSGAVHDGDLELTQTQANAVASDWTRTIVRTCLFVDQIWVPDPAELLVHHLSLEEKSRFSIALHWPLLENPSIAIEALRAVQELRSLAEAGVVRFYPPIALYRQAVAMPLWGTVRSFLPHEIKGAWPHTFVAEGLLFAASLGASYTALYGGELDALEHGSLEASAALGDLGQADARVVASLTRGKLPLFPHLDPHVLAQIRGNESALADFRDVLRDFARHLVAGVEDPDFDKEVQRLSRDYLTPELQKMSESAKWSWNLRSHASGAAMDFAAGVIGGVSITGDLVTGAATGAVTGVAKILLQLLSQRRPTRPAAQFILALSAPEHRRGAQFSRNEAHLRDHSLP